jgi:Fic family protein
MSYCVFLEKPGALAPMNSFRARLQYVRLPARTARLMSEIAESKGQQQCHTKLAGQFLRAFRLAARVRTIESSSRIEGITVAPGRLLPLLAGHVRPNSQSEREIRGFCRALDSIYTTPPDFQITPTYLLELHRTVLDGAPEAGEWRSKDWNEFRVQSAPGTFIAGVSVPEIPIRVEELCLSYREVLIDQSIHPLVAIAALILDFLALQPFSRGQSRMTHLLALLSLSQNGFEIGRYVSLGSHFVRSLEQFSVALRLSSQDWREGKRNLDPWLEYFFGVLRSAYQEFEQCVHRSRSPRGAKAVLVETAISDFRGEFGPANLEQSCPGVSRPVIDRTLHQLHERGLIRRTRRGSYIVPTGVV